MGRSSKGWISFCSLASISALALGAAAWAAGSGAGGEDFPESRFGAPPVKVVPGVRAGYASRAVEDMETADEAIGTGRDAPLRGSSRGIASVDDSAQGGSGTAAGSGGDNLPPRVGTPAPIGSTDNLSPTASRLKGVQEVAIIANDLGFFPKTVFVNRDVPVRMFVTGASKNTLCIMMDSFQVRRQLRSQKIEEITFTPNTPGKYRFYCPVNGMEGMMVVKELSSSNSFGN